MQAWLPSQDDIITEYHPLSYIPRCVWAFEDYGKKDNEFLIPPTSTTPWEPFQTRADFEVTEIVLLAQLSSTGHVFVIWSSHYRTVGNRTTGVVSFLWAYWGMSNLWYWRTSHVAQLLGILEQTGRRWKKLEFYQSSFTSARIWRHQSQRRYSKLQYEAQWKNAPVTEEIVSTN